MKRNNRVTIEESRIMERELLFIERVLRSCVTEKQLENTDRWIDNLFIVKYNQKVSNYNVVRNILLIQKKVQLLKINSKKV